MSCVLFWLLVVSTFFVASPNALAQQTDGTDKIVFAHVECWPEFPGGYKALMSYMKSEVRYPKEAQKSKVEGWVFVLFIIENDGSLTDIHVVKGIGYGCDEEAIRVAQTMPCWEPGYQDGKPVRVRYNLPVAFKPDLAKRK